MVSSTIRFTSSMSATLPVSFQYPVIVVDRTLRPLSISHWMASVISSSPRHDGASCEHRLVDGGGEDVDADQREIALGLLGLLLQADHLARGVQLGDAELPRIRHAGQHDLGVRPAGPELLDQGGDPADDEVVPQVHDEVVVAEEVAGDQDRVGQPAAGPPAGCRWR